MWVLATHRDASKPSDREAESAVSGRGNGVEGVAYGG